MFCWNADCKFWKDCGTTEDALGNQNAWFSAKAAATLPHVWPPTNHLISPFGFFFCSIRESDVIFKTLVSNFCSSLILGGDFILHSYKAIDSVLLIHCKYIVLIFLWKFRKRLGIHFCSLKKKLVNVSQCLIISLKNGYIFVFVFLNQIKPLLQSPRRE